VQIESNRKYAKWKAAYIHNCLKNGETPISGPLPDEDEDVGATGGYAPGLVWLFATLHYMGFYWATLC